jgi:hypothetical protein
VYVNAQRCHQSSDAYEPATYRICVCGRIAPSWTDRFEGMTLTTSTTTQGAVVTTLLGKLPDQAALVGVINSLHDLRLPVLCVKCLKGSPTGESNEDNHR